MLLRDTWQQYRTIAPIPYSQFQILLADGIISEVSISANQVHGKFREPQDGKQGFVTNRVDLDLAKDLETHGVTFKGQRESTILPMLLSRLLGASRAEHRARNRRRRTKVVQPSRIAPQLRLPPQ